MATLHSGYEVSHPQSSAARRNSEFIEIENIQTFRNEVECLNVYPPKSSASTPVIVPVSESTTPRHQSIYDSNIELAPINDPTAEPEFSLPPTDGGKDAWLFLFAAFILEILVWGFPFAYGIFQEYYSSNPPFAGQRNIAIIGTSAMGLMYLSSPLVFAFLARYPRSRRPCISIGLVIMCLALGLSSLSQTVPHLILTQGIFFAIGGSLCYSPAIIFMDEWFVTKKGFAFGMMWAGTGVGGVLIPLLLQHLLHTFGFRTTLQIWTGILFVSALPLALYIKPRLPYPSTAAHRPFDLSFIRQKAYLLLQLGNILESLGYFVPAIYLPTYAKTLGASNGVAALTLMLLNVATVVGVVIMGGLVDRWHITTCILFSTVGSTASVFLIWGFSTNVAALLVFCVLYGLFAGSYTTTYPGIMKVMKSVEQRADSTMVYAMLCAGRGVGNVLCGPLSDALMRTGEVGGVGLYATRYGPLVVFTGVSAALGGVSCFSRTLGWI